MTRARMPGRHGVPVVIHCYRTSLVRRAGWFLSDLWALVARTTSRG